MGKKSDSCLVARPGQAAKEGVVFTKLKLILFRLKFLFSNKKNVLQMSDIQMCMWDDILLKVNLLLVVSYVHYTTLKNQMYFMNISY